MAVGVEFSQRRALGLDAKASRSRCKRVGNRLLGVWESKRLEIVIRADPRRKSGIMRNVTHNHDERLIVRPRRNRRNKIEVIQCLFLYPEKRHDLESAQGVGLDRKLVEDTTETDCQDVGEQGNGSEHC